MPRVSGNCTTDLHDLAASVPEIKGDVMSQIVFACVMTFRHGSPRVTYPRRQQLRQIKREDSSLVEGVSWLSISRRKRRFFRLSFVKTKPSG